MPKIEAVNLTVTYPAKGGLEFICLDSLNAVFESNEINVILGESGSGKSTLLKAIAGTMKYDGEILFDDVPSRKISPKNRKIAFVDQEITLYPNRTIFDNLALPLSLSRLKPDEMRRKIHETAKNLGILATLSRLPRQISIGQQQRACLAKAIVKDPSVLLLDEPFSNIDENRRKEERELLKRLAKEKGITVVMATHLEEDVLSLGEWVHLLENGKISLSLKKEELPYSSNPMIRLMMASRLNGGNDG